MQLEDKHIDTLIKKHKNNELYNKIIILRGDIGLGQQSTLQQFCQFLKSDGFEIFDLSCMASSISMFQTWESVSKLMNTNMKELHSCQNGFTYSEFIISQIVSKCKSGTHILFTCRDIRKCDTQLLQFIEQIFEYVIKEYFTIFAGCDYSNSLSENDVDMLLANFVNYTYFINYKTWNKVDLKKYFFEIFNKPIRIEDQQINIILEASFGNPSKLLEAISFLKSEEIIIEEPEQYVCSPFSNEVFLNQMHIHITKQYNKLNTNEKQILKGSSLLGTEFDSDLLIHPLNFLFVEQNLNRIEKFTQLLHQKSNTIYEFHNVNTCHAIKNFITSDEYNMWNQLLAEFYYNRAILLQNKGNYVQACGSFIQSAEYYIENHYPQVSLMIYRNVISLLLSFMQYQEALNVIEKVRSVSKIYNIELSHFEINEILLLEAQCFYILGKFRESAFVYDKFLKTSFLNGNDSYIYRCLYALALYNCGEIERPYNILNDLYMTVKEQKINQNNAELYIEILSALCSVEETIGNCEFVEHFNIALALAHKYKLADIYNVLLRKSFIVHTGINGLRLLETAKKYFHKTNNKKEYAMTLHNMASLYLFTQDLNETEQYCKEAMKIFKEYGCDRIHYTYNCYGMYWILKCKYKKALIHFGYAYREKYEPFSKIVILLNQITAYRKLKYYKKAIAVLRKIEQIWQIEETSTYKILWPYYLLNRALLYHDMNNISDAYALYIEYLEKESSNIDYKLLLAVHNLKTLCEMEGFIFPAKFKHILQYKDQTYDLLKKHNVILNHLMFAE